MSQSLLVPDVLLAYRKRAQVEEKERLHPQAALSLDHSRRFEKEEDYRLPYKRDVDRIVHSKAFARYIDKTQVVYLVENDHITHRGLHVQLVSHFARGIGEMLRLNLNLIEAVALGHDVGHPPFGHEGEEYLSELSQEYGQGVFAHPWQSCRLFSLIEPLNLGLAVYDGFLCHDGGMEAPTLIPRFGKRWEDHEMDLQTKLQDPEKNLIPATLEGCLVKMCDTMSYIGRDIEDAISLGIIHREEVPLTVLGNSNREILQRLACDMIAHSFDKGYIAISDGVFYALKTLREFNFQTIYNHPRLKVESRKIKQAYRTLFEYLLKDWEKNKNESYLWLDFLHNKPLRYQQETHPIRLVIDYIAGMTDNFFVRTLEKLIVPKRIELF